MHDKDINMSSDEDFDLEGPVESDGNGSSRSAENSNEYFIASEDDAIIDDGNENYDPESEDDEEEIENTESRAVQRRRTRANTRQCATKTNKRTGQVIHREEMNEKQALKGLVQDGNLEYLQDTASENDDDESMPNKSPPKMSRRKYHKRRRLDSGEEESVGSSNAKRLRENLGIEFDEEAKQGSRREDTPQHTYFQAKHLHSPSRLKHVNCASTTDAKTKKILPKDKRHVCYVAADGSRHCYTLDTLYRVAIDGHFSKASAKPHLDIEFLQPPTFDAPMEADLLDQIASRFGRGVLSIEESKLYKAIQRWKHSQDPFFWCGSVMGSAITMLHRSISATGEFGRYGQR